ncbi:MAG TPA: hypothetical protein DDZ84_11695, partial [Firmicutes bacterium]|nr:hypothetical protein [Bacillota bacterium]
MQRLIKRVATSISEPLGRHMAWIPFSCRLGPQYCRSKAAIREHENMGVDERQNYILKGVQRIVRHAFFHNEFYGGVYREHGFAPDQLVTFDDICRIPVVTKALLKSVSIDRRSSRQFGRILVNTGGTSGEPLHFYLDRGAIAREWGHMHRIW